MLSDIAAWAVSEPRQSSGMANEWSPQRPARGRRGYDRAMAQIEDDGRPTEEPLRPAPQDPPFQALLPGLDKVSRSAFRKGTVSRKRINRAVLLLVVVAGVTAALITASVVL